MRHSLDVSLPDEQAWLFGDAVRLTQVFSNLLTNAAKYTDPGGQIRVRMQINAGQAAISVIDNGSGISADLLPRLFTIFEQGKTTIDRGKGGLGIGLALVKSFVELHGGSVGAASDGPGQGAQFTVILPLLQSAESSPAAAKQPAAAGKPTRSVRVLLVDDNVDALHSLSRYLSGCGHQVQATADPIEALRIASGFQPEVAVLDIGLPVLDGYALAAKIKETPALQGVRLVALTSYGKPRDVERSRAAGFDIHLVKPVLLQDLDAAIARLTPA